MATTSPQGPIGGWSNWNFTLPQNVMNVFNESLGKMLGVRYFDPIAYREQLVSGTNYKFICAAETMIMWPEAIYLVEAEVYQPLKGNPIVLNITEIGPVPNFFPVMGGWQGWRFPASPQAVTALSKVPKIVGVSYKPYGSTAQIVSGVNYCLICEQTIIVENLPARAVLLYLQQATDGQVHIVKIVTID